jgi:hypothetical protein
VDGNTVSTIKRLSNCHKRVGIPNRDNTEGWSQNCIVFYPKFEQGEVRRVAANMKSHGGN